MDIEIYKDGIGRVQLIDHMGSDLTIVNAARVSFGKTKEVLDNRDKKLIRYLINHKHTSTLEHNTVTFRFVVPLFIRSQHHRHRTWAYNEISRRYTDEDLKFYEPLTFRTQSKSNRQASNLTDEQDPIIYPDLSNSDYGLAASHVLKEHHKDSLNLYKEFISKGVCREQARGILPQNLYTEYYGTVNASNLLKFIELRTHDGAQWEIQQVAKACGQIALQLWPIMMEAYQEVRGADFNFSE